LLGRAQAVAVKAADGDIFERIDAAVAVARALTAAEEGAFMQHLLVGRYEGARPADWITDAEQGDSFLTEVESWWEKYGDKAMAYLMTLHQLPASLVRRLLNAAVYASLALDSTGLTTVQRRFQSEIAGGAALWARGYAEALGWVPHPMRNCRRSSNADLLRSTPDDLTSGQIAERTTYAMEENRG
jgi:hypothetical protein